MTSISLNISMKTKHKLTNIIYWLSVVVILFCMPSCVDRIYKYETIPEFKDNRREVDKGRHELTFLAKNEVEWDFIELYIKGKLIDFTSDEVEVIYINPNAEVLLIREIKGDWFTVQKVNDKTVKIVITENQENAKRDLELILRVGLRYDTLTVIQSS